ncbi:hypothetical protein [Candidatus Thioglobus sp.]|uniref:hypothetical protein n=1 Tax=Candidatus Thioglobus sp. TaxID=2026721 RepID=UPI003D13F6BD
MIASAIKQIIKTDRTGVTDFFSEVDKLHKTDEAVKNKIANDPELAKTLTDPNLTPKQKQSLTTQLVNGVMIELGYQEVAEVKVVFDANDKTRQGHYSKDGDIYLNDASIDNTKDLVTTAGHEASHVIDKQNPNININPTTKADNEIYAENYAENFGDYVEFASENYGDGNLASSNNHTGNNSSQTLKNNNRDYAQVDKSKGQDFLHINEEYDYANEMTNCGKTGYKCKNDTRKEYQAIYDKNKQDKIAEINKELNKPAFLRNRSNQEIKSAIDLVENRPFEEEITKIPEQSLNGVEVVSREKYVSRVEVETKKDAVATARAAANFVPVVRVINTGVAVVEGATKDYEDGGIDNSINNVIELIVPKIISKKIGISEKIPIGITTGISLGNDLSE